MQAQSHACYSMQSCMHKTCVLLLCTCRTNGDMYRQYGQAAYPERRL